MRINRLPEIAQTQRVTLFKSDHHRLCPNLQAVVQYDTLSLRAGHWLGPADSFDQRNFSKVSLSWAVLSWAVSFCFLHFGSQFEARTMAPKNPPCTSPSGAWWSLKEEEARIKQKKRRNTKALGICTPESGISSVSPQLCLIFQRWVQFEISLIYQITNEV